MTRVVKAIFENGVLRPLEPLELPERSEVELTIRARDQWAKDFGEFLARIHAGTRQFPADEIEADITAASQQPQRADECQTS